MTDLPETRCGFAGDPKHRPHDMTLTGHWPPTGPHARCVGGSDPEVWLDLAAIEAEALKEAADSPPKARRFVLDELAGEPATPLVWEGDQA